jgi:hypothetical protein
VSIPRTGEVQHFVPEALCQLSRLQLLDLSHNPLLHPDGCRSLAQAPLHQVCNPEWWMRGASCSLSYTLGW